MPVLSVYTAGVSTTGMECVNEAVKQAFGECSVEELGRENLRYKVRSGYRDSSVVLIILDETAQEECKDIENGLYNSSKYYAYTGDKELVDFLNTTYELSLDVPEDIFSVSVDSNNTSTPDVQINEEYTADLVEKYVSQLNDKDAIIRTLNYKIRELEGIISGEGYDADTTGKSDEEIFSLKDKLSDMGKLLNEVQEKLTNEKAISSNLRESLLDVEGKYAKLKKNFDILQKDLTKERVNSSQKSAVLRDNSKEIDKLKESISLLQKKIKENVSDERKVEDLNATIKKLNNEISNLKLDISTKDVEIERLEKVLKSNGDVSDQLIKYKTLLSSIENEKTEIEKELSALKVSYEDVVVKHDNLIDDVNDAESEVVDLKDKLAETEQFLAKANSDKLALQEKVKILELSVNRDTDIESTMAELSELRKKYSELKLNIFSSIADKSLPHSGVKVPIFKGVVNRLENVRFIFSGNTESRKGTYKCLLNEFSKNRETKYLLVDVTSETAIDYVFQMSEVVDGMAWFSSGGGVQKYLSPTCLANTKVLMPKIKYINDSFFLTVNWEKRLEELENSGYKVLVYCGDISNLVGRVLFEAFTDVSNTLIYVHGNAIGSRSIIANGSGLNGISKSSVAYYDFDRNVSKFYDIMCKKCKCNIISYIR